MKIHIEGVISAKKLWDDRVGTTRELRERGPRTILWRSEQDHMIQDWIRTHNGTGIIIAEDIEGAKGPKRYFTTTILSLCRMMASGRYRRCLYEGNVMPDDGKVLAEVRKKRLKLLDEIENASDDEDDPDLQSFYRRNLGHLTRKDLEDPTAELESSCCNMFGDVEVYYATNSWLQTPADYIPREKIVLDGFNEFLEQSTILDDICPVTGKKVRSKIRLVKVNSSKAKPDEPENPDDLDDPESEYNRKLAEAKISMHYIWKIRRKTIKCVLDVGAIFRNFEQWILENTARFGVPGVDNPFYIYDQKGNLTFFFDLIYGPYRFFRMLGNGKDQDIDRIIKMAEGFDNICSQNEKLTGVPEFTVPVYARSSITTPYEVCSILRDPEYAQELKSSPAEIAKAILGDEEDQAAVTEEQVAEQDKLYVIAVFEPDGITPARSIGKKAYIYNSDGSICSLQMGKGPKRIMSAINNSDAQNPLRIEQLISFKKFKEHSGLKWVPVKGEKGLSSKLSHPLLEGEEDITAINFDNNCPEFAVIFVKNVIAWIKTCTMQDLFAMDEGYVSGEKRKFNPALDTNQTVSKFRKTNYAQEMSLLADHVMQLQEHPEPAEQTTPTADKGKSAAKQPTLPLDRRPIGDIVKEYHKLKAKKIQELQPYEIKFDPSRDVISANWCGNFCPIMYRHGRHRSSEKNARRKKARDDPVRDADIFHSSNNTGFYIDLQDPTSPVMRFTCLNSACKKSVHSNFHIRIPEGIRKVYGQEIQQLYQILDKVFTIDEQFINVDKTFSQMLVDEKQ